jgi:2-amino-4-hydroxy-6-hydroxymethyldihydropteridine diphosphokinase/dihydropteroate synthase
VEDLAKDVVVCYDADELNQIETSLSPIQLLDRLQAIERGHGRVKLIDKGPRNIDLDIVLFRDEVVDSDRLIVPHMLMHEREFVLRPIME